MSLSVNPSSLMSMGNPQEPVSIKRGFHSVKEYAAQYQNKTAVSHFFNTRLSRVSELIADVKIDRVLDIGCGPCVTDKIFNPPAVQYYGVDISREMINECMVRFHHDPNFHFSVAGIEGLPFFDSCFDLVLCLGVMEYVADPKTAAREIQRVLKPGGAFIASMLNPRSPYRIWQTSVYPRIRRYQAIFSEPHLLIQRLKRKILKLRHSENGLPHHTQTTMPPFKMYNLENFLQLLVPNGLTVQEIVYYDFNLFLKPFDERLPRLSVWVSRRLEFLRRSKLKALGTGFIVKGRKD